VVPVIFRILGRLEAVVDGRRVEVSSRRERALLGVLLLQVGEVVSVDVLVDCVWGEPAPASARHMVHEYVSRLRGVLGDASVIVTRAPGYTVERDACQLDVARFADLLRTARCAVADDELDEALKAFDEALGLWRGDALCDVALEGDARFATARLDDERRAARSERVDVALALGRHNELIPDLERGIAAEPLDEQVLLQLMLALYRNGRQADALARYREGRRTLVGQVGIEPGAELRALEQAILRHDPALALPSTSEMFAVNDESPAPPPRRRRKGLAVAVAVVLIAGLATIAAFAARQPPSTAASVRGDAVAVVDAAHARLVGSVPVTAPPGAIAYGAGSVWVSFPDARSVIRISPESRRVAASIALEVPAQSLAVAGSVLWALGSGATDPYLTLERIDPTFGSVSRARRLPVVVTGDTGSLSGSGETLLVAPRTGLLTRIDARSGRTLGRLDPNAAPSAAALGFGSSWLAYREGDLVVRVDSSGAITQIPVGRGPSAIAIGKRAVWVTNAIDGTVESIDPVTSAVITTIPVGSTPTAIATEGDSVWVAIGGEGKLVRIDGRSNRVTATVEIGGSPQALAVGGGKVWVSVQTPPAAQPSGGTAVVSVPPFVTTLDPAVAFNGGASPLEYATCLMLLNYPDEPGAGGLRLVPDAARSLPTVSKDGRTYTFTVRPGMRFSPPSDQPVTAQTFRHAIERSLDPRMRRGGPPGQMFLADVVGAPAYFAGKTRHLAGVEAHGDRLTIHLTRRAPDLPARLAVSVFCAVPTDTPNRPVSGALPSAGPYYVASATPGRSFVLLRNPNYHGDRPHRLQRIEVIVGDPHPVAQIEASQLDYAIGGVPVGERARLDRLYGAHSDAASRGQQRYFVHRTLEVDYLDLNTRRPLFANVRMRRAASYAIDRSALAATGGSFSTAAVPAQMSIPPGMPGYRDAHVYPLVPDLASARRLAGSGHHDAELYCVLEGGSPRAAQIIKNNLAAIGIDVHVHCMPGDEAYTRIFRPNEPWDIFIDGYGADYNDPGEFINGIATDNDFDFTHYHDPGLSRRIRAASRLSGVPRAQAYARIDLALTRDTVPWINFANDIEQDFFSARIGCQLSQPVEGIDLAALCVRHT
jgi:YVTN family beta-propeller protein